MNRVLGLLVLPSHKCSPLAQVKKSASDDDERTAAGRNGCSTAIYPTYNSGEAVRGKARTLIGVSLQFISVSYLVRGARMIQAFDSNFQLVHHP